jgi:hypothetical protein
MQTMRTKLLVSACAVTIAAAFAGSAMAAQPSGSIGAGYGYTDANGGGGHLNDWNVDGSVYVPIDPQWAVQVDANYHGLSASGGGGSIHTDNASVSGMWNQSWGRIGATAGTNEIGGSGSSTTFQNYGAFGVFYPSSQLTLGAKAGQLSGSGSHLDYYGAEVIGYATPNVALSASVDNVHQSGTNLTSYSVGGEWQPTAQPWTAALTYDNTKSFGTTLNTYGIRLKWYFGAGSNLAQRQREGAETWGTKQTALRF